MHCDVTFDNVFQLLLRSTLVLVGLIIPTTAFSICLPLDKVNLLSFVLQTRQIVVEVLESGSFQMAARSELQGVFSGIVEISLYV